ncbi:hypothetical protein [Nitrosopumilus sp.]|uniref:hypothetical protein n=1 Tax=Nitrosopumilus sp. TaxID=2024843 RepID=UPI00292FCF15|nr:hypothetical protein [Nitrosopumilus sp.]
MTKRIEEELAEMKRLELEFLFFRAGMDNTLLKKYRDVSVDKKITCEDITSNFDMSKFA